MPEKDMGARLAQKLVSNNVLDLLSFQTSIALRICNARKMGGKNPAPARSSRALWRKRRRPLLGGRRDGYLPEPDVPLRHGGRLILIAPKSVVEKMDHMLG